MTREMEERILRGESVFTGSAMAMFGRSLVTALVSLVSLGIATPWMVCKYQRFVIGNTYIGGRKLRFDGVGGRLFGKWILWELLTVVTFGIYGIWATQRMQAWFTMHTHFDDDASVGVAPPVYTPPVSYDAPPAMPVSYDAPAVYTPPVSYDAPAVAPVSYDAPPVTPVYYEEPPVAAPKKAKPLYKLPESEVMPDVTPVPRSTPPASEGDGPVVKFGNLKK